MDLCQPQAGGDSEHVHPKQIQKHQEPFGGIDHVPPIARFFSMQTLFYIFQDNEAVIKKIDKGRSPTMCHVSRTLRVALDRIYDRINLDPMIQVETQHSNWQTLLQKDHSQETNGQDWHYLWTSWLTPHLLKAICQFLLQLWNFFPACVNVPENISLHPLARSNSQFIAQDWLREELAIRMPTWTITQNSHLNIKLEATPSVKTCVSNILKEVAKWPEALSSRQLNTPGASSAGRPAATEDLSCGKNIFVRILKENSISRRSTIPQRISSRRAHRFMLKKTAACNELKF